MSVSPSSSAPASSPSSAPAPAVTSLEGGAVRIQPANGRATPKGPTFGSVLAQAKPLLKGAEAAASVLPGGPLLAAAVKGAPTTTPMSGSGPGVGGKPVAAGVPMVPNATTGGVAPSVGVGAGAPAGASAGAAAEGGGVEAMLAESQAFNLYYLQLQEEVSAENRSYTTLSNVLKARHDTVKNAIGNIR
jgi:hypothetical protein